MGVITTGNHPKAMWPGINAWFGRQYAEHKPQYVDLFDKETSTRNYEEDVLVTGFGLAPVKAQAASTKYASEEQGYVARHVHVAYSLGYIVTREELDDNLYEMVSKRRSQALAFSMNQTKETVAANVYNRAFNDGYLGGDGVELLSDAHPTKSGNQSNELASAADLSEASIEDLIIQIMGATNDQGHKISLMPECLIVPRQLYFEANRVLDSVLQNDTANNATNVLKATNSLPKGIKKNLYLTDQDAFFIRTNCPRGMINFERVPMHFTQDNDFDTDNAKSKCYERYSFYWTDWRALYGCPGA